MKIKLFYILFGLACVPFLKAQTDAQLSLNYESPIFLNPAQTGDIDGTIRAGINYRNQWNSVDIPFETTILYSDFKIQPKFLNQIPLGIGFMFLNDRIGSNIWRVNNLTTSLSMPLKLGKNKLLQSAIYIALQEQTVNLSNLNFESGFDYLNLQYNFSTFSIGSNTNSLIDFGLGSQYQHVISNKFSYKTGLGVFHLFEPNNSLYTVSNEKLQRKWHFHGMGFYQVKKDIQIVPSFFYATQGSASSLIIGSEIVYAVGRRVVEKIDLRLGAYYRLNDAMIYSLGINHDNFTFLFSYDFTTSILGNFNNRRGGFELSIRYVNRMFKGGKDFKYILPGSRLL